MTTFPIYGKIKNAPNHQPDMFEDVDGEDENNMYKHVQATARDRDIQYFMGIRPGTMRESYTMEMMQMWQLSDRYFTPQFPTSKYTQTAPSGGGEFYTPPVPPNSPAASPDSGSGSVFRCPVLGREGRSSVALRGRSKAIRRKRKVQSSGADQISVGK